MNPSLTSIGRVLVCLILSMVTASCDGSMDDMGLGDLFFGIAIGQDTADVVDAMNRRGWYKEEGPPPELTYSHRMEYRLDFLERGGSGQLSVTPKGSEVASVWRGWTWRPADSVHLWRFVDSLQSVLDGKFSRTDPGASTWIIASEPDTVLLLLVAPSPARASNFVEAWAVTAREFRERRRNQGQH